jgi:hypothetical protein
VVLTGAEGVVAVSGVVLGEAKGELASIATTTRSSKRKKVVVVAAVGVVVGPDGVGDGEVGKIILHTGLVAELSELVTATLHPCS